MSTYLKHLGDIQDKDFFNNLFNQLISEEDNTMLKTDIKETEKNYIMEVEVPGFKKEDINISLDRNYLTISATKKEEDAKSYIRKERFTGTCKRSFYVGDVNKDSITASYENGILTLTILKEDPEVVNNKHMIAIN